MTGKQLFNLPVPFGLCETCRQTEWIKPVKIPSGRQYLWRTKHVATFYRLNETTIKRTQNRPQLVILAQRCRRGEQGVGQSLCLPRFSLTYRRSQ